MVREFLFWSGKVMEFSVANPIGTRCLGWKMCGIPRCQPYRHAVFGLENVCNSALPTLSAHGVWVGNATHTPPWQNEFSQFPRVTVHC